MITVRTLDYNAETKHAEHLLPYTTTYIVHTYIHIPHTFKIIPGYVC